MAQTATICEPPKERTAPIARSPKKPPLHTVTNASCAPPPAYLHAIGSLFVCALPCLCAWVTTSSVTMVVATAAAVVVPRLGLAFVSSSKALFVALAWYWNVVFLGRPHSNTGVAQTTYTEGTRSTGSPT